MADHKNLNMFGTFLKTLRAAESEPRRSSPERFAVLPESATSRAAGSDKESSWQRSLAEDPTALVLDLLDENGPLPLEDLIRHSGRSLQTVLRVLDRLDRFGLVSRQPRGESESDLYEITATGRAARLSYHRPTA